MKKLLKKRQLILVTLVLALGAAVFVNWYYTKPIVAADGSTIPVTQVAATQNEDHLGDSLYVHNPYSSSSGEYFAGAKLKRSAAHDEAKETLNDIITNSKADAKAVADASKALQALANSIKLEGDCESLITAKTGSECIVTIGDGNVQAVLGGEPIDGAMAMQIKEILLEKTGYGADQISIVELNG